MMILNMTGYALDHTVVHGQSWIFSLMPFLQLRFFQSTCICVSVNIYIPSLILLVNIHRLLKEEWFFPYEFNQIKEQVFPILYLDAYQFLLLFNLFVNHEFLLISIALYRSFFLTQFILLLFFDRFLLPQLFIHQSLLLCCQLVTINLLINIHNHFSCIRITLGSLQVK